MLLKDNHFVDRMSVSGESITFLTQYKDFCGYKDCVLHDYYLQRIINWVSSEPRYNRLNGEFGGNPQVLQL